MLQRETADTSVFGNVRAPGSASVDIWTSFAGHSSDGGDWCESLRLDGQNLALTVGDVAGHGDVVAPTKRVVRNSVASAIGRLRSPSDVMVAANHVVCNELGNPIVTAVVAFLDQPSLTLHFANAGHPPPLLVTARGSRYLTRRQADLPLGVFSAYESLPTKVSLAPGTMLVLYTDGVTEHRHDAIGGESELAAAARYAFTRTEFDAARVIADRIFAEGRGNDDAAILVLRTCPVRVRYSQLEPRP